MDVFHDEHQRPATGGLEKQEPKRVERPRFQRLRAERFEPGRSIDDAEKPLQQRARLRRQAVLGNEAIDRALNHRRRIRFGDAAQCAKDFGQRQIRDQAAVREERPSSIAARPDDNTGCVNSSRSRDLPMPGSPTTLTA